MTCIGSFNIVVKVTQLCPALHDPMVYTVHGILQAGILQWIAFPFSRRSSPPQGLSPGLLYYRWILYQLSPKGSPRIPEWVAYPFFSRSSWPRNRTRVSCIAGGFFTNWAIREAKYSSKGLNNNLLCSSSNSLNLWMWPNLENKGLCRDSQGSQGELILDVRWAQRPNIGVCVQERQRFET